MTRRILFVDDEPMVLEGLRRILHSQRADWELAFTTSGSEALELLAKDPYDVLVTDMRIAKMDGAQVLTKVRDQFPNIVRIVLSGQYERDVVYRSVALAHRYLSKPCDAETLRSTIRRACTLRELLSSSDTLLAVASRLESVPSLPTIYWQVVNELESREPSLQRIGKLVSQDAGMTAKIMQIINSAYFGMRGHVADPAQAVILLGAEMIKGLVLVAHIFTELDKSIAKLLSLDMLWRHSQRVAHLAALIARAESSKTQVVQDAALAGMLHDMGKIVLSAHRTQEYKAVLIAARKRRMPSHEVERETFGATHAELGGYLLGLWGIPDTIVEAVAAHHRPAAIPTEGFTLLAAVHVANCLAHEELGTSPYEGIASIDYDYLNTVGLGHRLAEWQRLAEQNDPRARQNV